VQPDELAGFFTRYAEVCKEAMAKGLKKRDRKKKTRAKKKVKREVEGGKVDA
jgi:signal recognition particle subunit SRP14